MSCKPSRLPRGRPGRGREPQAQERFFGEDVAPLRTRARDLGRSARRADVLDEDRRRRLARDHPVGLVCVFSRKSRRAREGPALM